MVIEFGVDDKGTGTINLKFVKSRFGEQISFMWSREKFKGQALIYVLTLKKIEPWMKTINCILKDSMNLLNITDDLIPPNLTKYNDIN